MAEMEVDELESDYGDAEDYDVDENDTGPKPFSIR